MDDAWSAVADGWAELWGRFSDPARLALIDAAGIGPGSRVLDVGCGSGEFVALLQTLGVEAAGADPAAGMVGRARAAAPGADIRVAGIEALPWPAGAFDAVVAVNALQFADDVDAALAEAVRVTAAGGAIAVANWAEAALNDLDTVEAAVARAHGDEPGPDPDYRLPGVLAQLLRAAGLVDVVDGVVQTPWTAADDDALVRGALLGEDAEGLMAGAAVVLDAGRAFRRGDGSYRLENAFRWAVGRRP